MATEREKTVRFGKANCQILDKDKLVAVAIKVEKLYYLKCCMNGVYSTQPRPKSKSPKKTNGIEDCIWVQESCRN